MDGASPVARKEADVAVTVSAQAAAHGDQAAHVQETDIPYSIACSVPLSPSGLHLGACTSICSDGDAVRMAINLSEEPWRDRRFDHLKTFSSCSCVERQLSTLHPPAEIEVVADSKIISEEEEEETDDGDGDGDGENEVPSADRYFSALQGPELETLRATEVSTLPDNETWPFLLRFPVSAFGMCLGVSSQAMLWKSLETEPSMAFLHVSPAVNQALWWVSMALTGRASSPPSTCSRRCSTSRPCAASSATLSASTSSSRHGSPASSSSRAIRGRWRRSTTAMSSGTCS